MGTKSRSWSGINIPDHISEKILKSFDADPGSEIFLPLDLGSGVEKFGSGIKIPDPQHWDVQCTLYIVLCRSQDGIVLPTFLPFCFVWDGPPLTLNQCISVSWCYPSVYIYYLYHSKSRILLFFNMSFLTRPWGGDSLQKVRPERGDGRVWGGGEGGRCAMFHFKTFIDWITV